MKILIYAILQILICFGAKHKSKLIEEIMHSNPIKILLNTSVKKIKICYVSNKKDYVCSHCGQMNNFLPMNFHCNTDKQHLRIYLLCEVSTLLKILQSIEHTHNNDRQLFAIPKRKQI